jgi:hypothetical protein
MINTKLQSIIDTKSAIGNAITNKGGTITTNTPFFNYAAQIDGISTGAGAYSNFVAQAQDNSKYTVYNGYDSQTNPTPNLSNNFAFNRWLLNNSATGDVILSNVVVANGGTFNGPNTTETVNISKMSFINNTASYGNQIWTVTTNNGFIYVGGVSNNTVQKFYESNLAFVGNTASYGGTIYSVITNNGFIYASGQTNQTVQKFYESNLAFVGNTVSYGERIFSIQINNGFIYAGGGPASGVNRGVTKFYESNLALTGANLNASSTPNYGGDSFITKISVSNGFIYAGGGFGSIAPTVQKFGESNLAFIGNTANYGGDIRTVTTNNGFIYVGGQVNQTVQKFYESNLAFVSNSNNYNGAIWSLTTNNGFIYAAGHGTDLTVKKYYESNLTFLAQTNAYSNQIFSITINNGFIYAGGNGNATDGRDVKKYEEQGLDIEIETETFYNITNIKE